jgi:5-methylcytosine-specific restriction endonuclease McrA
MNTNQIRALSDKELISDLRTKVLEERKNMTEVLEFLREVDRRRLYAEWSCSSLWEFCTKELKYSSGATSRRIAAMRLLRDLPELKEDLESGKQNLSSLGQAQKYFHAEEKATDTKLTRDQKREVLEQIEGKSTREVEKDLLELSSAPIEIKKPEKKRAIDKTHTELRLVLDAELLEKLDRIQALRSHADPSFSYIELLKFMASDILKRLDPVEKEKIKVEKSHPAPGVKPKAGKNRVAIPTETKRQVWLRDQGRCAFKDCHSTHFLEIDHIIPVALGGSNDPSNLRVRCRGHNQRYAVTIYGVEKMQEYILK